MRIVLLIAAAAAAAAQSSAPQPAVYKTGAALASELQAGNSPEMLTAAVSNTEHHRVNLVKRTKAAGAIAHPDGDEVHHIVEGAATFVTGGTIVRPASGGSATIAGGESRRVAAGDVIFIPAGTPHWYKDLEGSVSYLEVRFDAK